MLNSLKIPHLLAGLLLAANLCLPGHAAADIHEDLIWAVEDNNATDLTKLLAKGADPNTYDKRGNTLLMIAVQNKNNHLIHLLLEAGANPNLRNHYGETAIMLASYHGEAGMAKQFYIKGAEINHKGWNPLIYAATKGHTEIVEMLLDVGAKIDSTSDNGTTALMMAARGDHLDAVKLLLQKGANPNIRNESGGTALSFALSREHLQVAKLLRVSGATH
ncbi:MAG: ankyrin repeat domain-containing protein [Nitrosomonadaceae bacterium]|nr:ankyrin repeat domain-containing protein [Nitrosomonadaceae bacterium]